MATAARASVEPVSWFTSSISVSIVRPSPTSEMPCAAHRRRKSGSRRTSRDPKVAGAGVSVIARILGCRLVVGRDTGHRVEAEDEAIGIAHHVLGVVLVALEQRLQALLELRGALG